MTLSNLDPCFTPPYAPSPPPFPSSFASSSSSATILLLLHPSLSRHQKGSRGKTGFSSSIKPQLCAYLLEPFHLFIYLLCVLCVVWLTKIWLKSLRRHPHCSIWHSLREQRTTERERERWDAREGGMKREAKHVRRRDDSLFVPNYACMYLCTFAPCVKTFQGENIFLQICVSVVPPECTVCARPHLQARDANNYAAMSQHCAHADVWMHVFICMCAAGFFQALILTHE